MKKLMSIMVIVFFSMLGSYAQADENMNNLLLKAQQVLALQQVKENQRLVEFRNKKADKALLLETLRVKVEAAKEKQQQLLVIFGETQVQEKELLAQLQQRSSQLKTVFSLTKQYAQQLTKSIDSSFSSGRYIDRQKQLEFASQTEVPTLDNIKTFWFMQLQELVANAGIQSYTGLVINEAGVSQNQLIHQLGPFVAISDTGKYLRYNAASKRLQSLVGLDDDLQTQALEYAQGAIAALIIDPEKGKLLIQQTKKLKLIDRIHQGGLIGYIIVALGAMGLLIATWRLLYMMWVSIKIKRQCDSVLPMNSNPLGRVLLAAQNVNDVERAELLLDKALLQEQPKLESFHSLVKLLAAVAPLLGLLGTVTGMIETFQSITLYGTSDPKLMAQGISQALVTTVMGLCVAIPLLFCHNFISANAKRILQLIQQQSLLLLSDYYIHTDQPIALNAHEGNTNASAETSLENKNSVKYGSTALA